MVEVTKSCRLCGVVKPLTEFHRATGMKDGHRGECAECGRARRREWYKKNREKAIANVKAWQAANPERVKAQRKRLNATPERKRKMRDLYYRRTFGISADEFDALLEKQGGVCAICGSAPERGASLHLDHDHVSGKVRKILCLSCNQGIGKFRDDPDLLERAAGYIREARATSAAPESL